MDVIIKKTYEDMSKRAAEMIADAIRRKPNIVLGLATGSTPIGLYKELIRMHKEEGLDFSKVITFNLDEYYGLSKDDNQSYHYYMYKNLFDHVNIKKENIHIPDGTISNVEEYCRKYDEAIEKCGGIDLQILGIGANGHIGFNEPADELIASTHLTDLTEDTIKANSRFFDSMEQVPKRAITMGIGTILKAKKIILLANGKEKASAISYVVNRNKITPKIPATLLLGHSNVTVILDKEACSFDESLIK